MFFIVITNNLNQNPGQDGNSKKTDLVEIGVERDR